MTLRTRRGLFYGLIALFLIAGTSIVLYAQGLRFDLTTGKISKIGAIYVRSYPKDATITLNGKLIENKSGFLSAGTLISDLFPKTYNVKLAEAGFAPWQESVSVLPSLVVSLKYSVLIPQNATTTATGTTLHFIATPGIITKENAAETITSNGKVVGVGTLASSTLDGHAFLSVDANGNERLYDRDTSTSTNISAMLQKDGISGAMIQSIILDPRDSSAIIVLGQKKIWLLDPDQNSLTLIETVPAKETLSPALAIGNSLIAWTRFADASTTSEIMLYDRGSGTLRETATTFPGVTQKLAWIRGNTLGILQDNGSLSLFDAGADTAQTLASDAKDFSATNDGTLVAVLEHQSTEIFNLDDPTGYFRFNLPDVARAQQLTWYRDGDHLFVTYPDHISFLDFQDLSLTNFATVANGTAPSYDPNSNVLYFIDPQSQLMQLSFPE